MVGRREPLIGPLTGQAIQTSAHLDTDLQKCGIFWILGMDEQGIQRSVTVDGPIFCRDPQSKIGNRGQAFEESHKSHHLERQQALHGDSTA